MGIPPEWSRVANTTIHEYIRDEQVNVLRNRKLTAMMQQRGRISFNHEGDLMDWKVKYKLAPMAGYADSDTLTFPRRDYWKTAQLPWRGYAATDSMTKLEKLKNKGAAAIIKIASEIVETLMTGMKEQFGQEFYIDGEAAGNTKRIHGIESFFGTSGSSTVSPTGLANSTYGGLLCTLGNYGGTTGVGAAWPVGTFDSEYDFWTPLIVNYTSTVAAASGGWSNATKTWPNTCREALRYGIIKGQRNDSQEGQIELALLENELYRQFKNLLDGEERAVVSRGDGKAGLYALGFNDSVNFDGCDISFEYGIPANVGYGFCFPAMELRSLQGQLFVADDVDFDVASQSDRYAITMFGNARFNPRNMVKWAALG